MDSSLAYLPNHLNLESSQKHKSPLNRYKKLGGKRGKLYTKRSLSPQTGGKAINAELNVSEFALP